MSEIRAVTNLNTLVCRTIQVLHALKQVVCMWMTNDKIESYVV